MKLLIRWAASSLALFAAVYFVPGIRVDDPDAWVVYIVMALILGLVNAIIRPILKIMSCPFIILTLGLFVLVINASMFLLASRIAQNWFNVGFYVDDFISAVFGSLIVSFITIVINGIIKEEKKSA